jgi:hypothetical protein
MEWPEREPGWEVALIERARSLFAETAERFDLRYEWEDKAPVEVACRYPMQAGLDFDLWLSLCGDEFVCSGKDWYASIFPADDAYKWSLIVALVEGLITGEARIALYRALGRSRPYWSEVQLCNDGRWQTVSTGAGCAIPPIVRPTILRNRHPTDVGRFRPALGSAFALLLVIGLVVWLRS